MLKPHLHTIVNRSMELALTTKEPYNYFLLLRALFRSIGGGSHDLLYQEFLPLLPNLLQGLNCLQSGLHKQHMKDLFVELCLTVPVRLSSLLPYLPMLMDPLVSALNGSQTLVSQGLRTLELCVDNLQPDFLYDHIQPVRAELMQALWHCLRNPPDNVAHVAFRVLGKFGGSNRKMLKEAQKLAYNEQESGGPGVLVYFQDCKTAVSLPAEEAINVALNALKSSSTDTYYRKQAWIIVKCFLVSTTNLDDDKQSLTNLFTHFSFVEKEVVPPGCHLYKCTEGHMRQVQEQALAAMFVAAAIKELRAQVLNFMASMVRHYTMVAIAQQCGPFPLCSEKQSHLQVMDAQVLIDALAVIMGHEEKELCKPGQFALMLILEASTTILGSRDRACQLMLFEYLAERMCSLCYDRAWYSKLGGCQAIKFMFEKMSLRWVLDHQFLFLKALLFVMMDLTGEVSSGALDLAKVNLEQMLRLCAEPLTGDNVTEDLTAAQTMSLRDVIHELVRQVTSPNTLVRDQAMHCLQVLADSMKQTVTEIMEPHKDVLQDMIPPKKHLLRYQPANAQIGLMEGNTFCTTLEPRLFTIDLNTVEHKVFFTELFSLCEAEDAILLKLPCYKSVSNLVPLRKSAMRALSACHYIPQTREKIFKVLYKALNSVKTELQTAAHDCMKKFITGFQIDMEMVHTAMRPLLLMLGDYRGLSLNVIHVLSSLTQLFPNTFNEKLCEQLLSHLKNWMDEAVKVQKTGHIGVTGQVVSTELKTCAAIINVFHLIPAASQKMIEPLTALVLKGERELLVEVGSPFQEPLIKFLARYPQQTVDIFLSEVKIKDPIWNRCFQNMLEVVQGEPFRLILKNSLPRLISLALTQSGTGQVGGKSPWCRGGGGGWGGLWWGAGGGGGGGGGGSPCWDDRMTCLQSDTGQSGTGQVGGVGMTYDVSTEWYGSSGWCWDDRMTCLQSEWYGSSGWCWDDRMTCPQSGTGQVGGAAGIMEVTKAELQYQAILIINILVHYDDDWLPKHPPGVITNLLKIWVAESFQERHKKVDNVDYIHWQEPRLLVECLLNYFRHHPNEIELLFHLLRSFTARFMSQFQFFKDFLEETIAQTYSVDWKRKAFFKFVEIFHDQGWPQTLKAKILQHILIPSFANSFEKGEGERLIGGIPAPDQDSTDNVISVFINRVIDPDNPFGTSDAVRILLLQFSSLLVEQASAHIHDAANKKQGNKLRRLMTFAWPCLLAKSCVDPATKYHGHLLLSHIIAKFAIHKRIVLQVFHSLLKAHAVEARTVVRQALEILTPAMPGRMEDGNGMLTHWTKKIIVEEGHTMAQLVHILQLLVRHYKVYYPVRHHLIQHMVSSIHRLGFTPSATMEHRKLAVDLAEVVIKWELQRTKEDQEQTTEVTPGVETPQPTPSPVSIGAKRLSTSTEPTTDAKKLRHASGTSVRSTTTDTSKPIDKQFCDAVVNFLLRIACQVNEASTTMGSPGELLSRRCVTLLKMALRPEVWPSAELKLAWFDKILMTVESHQPNFANICTALELLSFLLTILRKEVILLSFKPLQRGIAACMTCPNSKVIRSVHSLLSRLMSIFPTEPATSNVASKYEELECLYACVSKVVYEGLTKYEKTTSGSPSQLFGTLMILKAACMHNTCYIDRLITSFMRVLQRMAREHLTSSTTEPSPVASELLILSLDLVKNRVGVMGPDMRKGFIGGILVGLIEKTHDNKVIKAITKMVEDWVKIKTPIAINQSPSLREKAILLVKLMQHVEKRFPEDHDLNAQFLELVNYIYRDETLSGSELTSKLEPAFLAGLRCQQPQIRQKFVDVFDSSVKKRIYDRLLYIVCSQNWEAMAGHFWIKQCIELLLNVAVNGLSIQSSSTATVLPSPTSVISLADSHDKAAFLMVTKMKEEPMDVESLDNKEEDEIDIELAGTTEEALSKEPRKKETHDRKQNLQVMLQRQAKFLETCREVKTVSYLHALSQLCHSDTHLAHDTWLQLFPRVWKVLSERMQHGLAGELGPFLCSGSHVIQKDVHPSSIHTFLEALCHCVPAVPIRPCVLKYLGKTHNLWHRAALMLEQMAFQNGLSTQLVRTKPVTSEYEFEPVTSPQQETLDSLCELYSLLKEEDLLVGLWLKRAKFAETSVALAYEQHGFFEQAQQSYEQAMGKARQDHNSGPASLSILPEYKLWEDHWIRCSKELNQWDLLLEYASVKGNTNPHLVLESAWRVPNWTLMKDALAQVELSCPKELAWKVNLYRGYIAICHPDDHHLNMIDRLVETSSNLAIKEWRRLPSVVSHIHVGLLQVRATCTHVYVWSTGNHVYVWSACMHVYMWSTCMHVYV
ncbi:Transformation/transcription domain-associated protein [Lamellibrachia satsuma]|nr:Transformation/transcription domain-associated protein [Lamellibrachia satsuma]